MSGMFASDEENPDLMYVNGPSQGGSAPAPKPITTTDNLIDVAKQTWNAGVGNHPLVPKSWQATRDPRLAINQGPKQEAPNQYDEEIKAFSLGQEDKQGDNSTSAINPYTKTPFVVGATASNSTQAAPPPIKGEEKDVDPSLRSGTSNRIVDATKAAGEADKEAALARAIGAGDAEVGSQAIADLAAGTEVKLKNNADERNAFTKKMQEAYQDAMKMQVEDTPAQTFFKTIGNIMGTIGYSLMSKSGRPELAAQMMDKSLEREYRAQQDQKAQKGKKLGEIQNSLDFFVKSSGDERLGHLQWEEAAIRKYVAQAKAAADRAGTAEAKAAYNKIAAVAELRTATVERQIQNTMQVYGRNYAGNLAGGGFDTNNPGKIGKIEGQPDSKRIGQQQSQPAATGQEPKPGSPEYKAALDKLKNGDVSSDNIDEVLKAATSTYAPQATAGKTPSGAQPSQQEAKSKSGVPPMLARDATTAAAATGRQPRVDLTPNERADIRSQKTKPDTFNIVNFTGTARPFLIPKESDSPDVRSTIADGGEAKANLRAYADAYAKYKAAANGNFGMTDILRKNGDENFAGAEAAFKGVSGTLIQKVAKLYDTKSAVRDADVEFALNHAGLVMQGNWDKLQATFKSQAAIDAATVKSIKVLNNFVDTKMSELRKSRGIVKGTRVIVKVDKNNNIVEATPEEIASQRSKDNNPIREYIQPDVADSTYSTMDDFTKAPVPGKAK